MWCLSAGKREESETDPGGGGPGRGQVQGTVGRGSGRTGFGEDGVVEAWCLAGSGYAAEGSRGARGGLCTGCGEEHTGGKPTGFTSGGAQRSRLGVPILLGQRDKPGWGGGPVSGPGWPGGAVGFCAGQDSSGKRKMTGVPTRPCQLPKSP